MSEKFIRYQQEYTRSVERYRNFVTHQATTYLINPLMTTVDDYFDGLGITPESWMRLKFRVNIPDTFWTTTYPNNIGTGSYTPWWKVNIGQNADGSAPRSEPSIFIDAGEGVTVEGKYAEYIDLSGGQTNKWFFSASFSEYTTGFSGRIFENFENRINELVIHKDATGVTRYYYGEANVSGTLPLIRTQQHPSGTFSGATHGAWYIDFQANVGAGFTFFLDLKPVNRELLDAISFDVFAFEHGTGAIPSGAIERPIQLTGVGFGDDFSNYLDMDDFVAQIVPTGFDVFSPIVTSSIYRSTVFSYGANYPDFDVVPFWEYTNCYEDYGEIGGVGYWNEVTDTWEDQPLSGVWSTLANMVMYPTSSEPFGYMMGPLTVGGGGGPPPTSSIQVGAFYGTSPIYLKYALTQAPSHRKGLFLQAHSGSPQLSLEPVWPTSSWHLPGDVWFANGEGYQRGLFYADYSSSYDFSGSYSASVVPYRVFGSTSSYDIVDGGSF